MNIYNVVYYIIYYIIYDIIYTQIMKYELPSIYHQRSLL